MYGLSDRLMHWQLICLVQVRFRTEVPRTPSSARSGLELFYTVLVGGQTHCNFTLNIFIITITEVKLVNPLQTRQSGITLVVSKANFGIGTLTLM